VFTLRCTSRLIKRLGPSLSTSSIEPTTRLGDWYANLIHVGRLQLVLGVSERTLLPVVVPAAPISALVPRLRVGLAQVLGALRIPKEDIAMEDAAMESVAYGKTANRQVTGIMVDFARTLEFHVDDTPSLLHLSLRLAETPCSPLFETTVSPDATTVALFTARSAEVERPETLHDALRRLKEWLARGDDFPGWREERIIEIGRGTRYERAGAGPYAWRVDAGAVSTPATYARRFEELLGAGYSWINLSCYGILDGVAVIAVELPRSTAGVPKGKTSVNVSGPPIDVTTGSARWNAEGYVVID
jgi:hypothetical protein